MDNNYFCEDTRRLLHQRDEAYHGNDVNAYRAAISGLVEKHLGLVGKIARGMAGSNLHLFDDLFQEGSISLLKSAESYCLDDDWSFDRFVKQPIRWGMRSFMRETYGTRGRRKEETARVGLYDGNIDEDFYAESVQDSLEVRETLDLALSVLSVRESALMSFCADGTPTKKRALLAGMSKRGASLAEERAREKVARKIVC